MYAYYNNPKFICLLPSLIPILGFFIRGVSGFGSALIITPLLLFFYDLKTVVSVVAILEVVSTAYFTIEIVREVNWDDSRKACLHKVL